MRMWVKMSNHNDPKISFIILMKKMSYFFTLVRR